MRPPARCLSIALMALMGVPRLAGTRDHLVTPAEVTARVQAAAAARRGDELKLNEILARHFPATTDGASVQERVRARVAALGDDEVRELARRAEALETDPVAGGLVKTLVIVGILVLLVLLAIAIVESCKEEGAECVD